MNMILNQCWVIETKKKKTVEKLLNPFLTVEYERKSL